MEETLEARIEQPDNSEAWSCRIYSGDMSLLATVWIHPDSSATEMGPEEADAQFACLGWERKGEWEKAEFNNGPWLWRCEVKA